MKSHWLFALFGLVLLAAWGVSQPVQAQSARIDFSLSVDDDSENYYKFRSPERSKRERHNPMVWKAARDLQQAKRKLWAAGGPDFGGNRVKAIRKINEALAILWAADQYDIRHMDRRDRRDRRDDRRDDHRGHDHH
jgi:hypothetical protein